MKSWKWLFVLVSVLILLCVQNVSAKTMSNADLNGRYIVGSVTMDIINGFATDIFQIDANGSGTYDYLYLYSSSEEEGEFGSSNYTVSLDGELTIFVESIYKMVGGISSDGQYFSVTWYETGAEPSIVFGIKESTNMTTADLSGTYDMYAVFYEDNMLQTGTLTMILNGSAGTWYWLHDINDNGTYSVNSEGHITFESLTGNVLNESHNGIVSNDGNVFFIVSTDDPVLEIGVGVRRSTDMSISDFTGNYHYTEWGFDYSLVNNYLKSISIGKDSIFAYQDLFNTSSLPLKSGEVNISTNSNGSFNYNNGFTGTLSSDGNVFAMNGDTGSYRYLGLGIAKSSGIDLAPKPNITPIISLLLDDDNDGFTSSDFTGSYNFSEQYDLNISNGVTLGLGSMTFKVTQIDANNLNLQGTGTNPDEGTYSFQLPLIVSGNTATLPSHPYPIPGGSGNLLEMLLLSDGNNMVYTGVGQEQDNLADISLGVGNWLRTPTPVTIDDFVGTWSGIFYTDRNLSYTPEGFDVSYQSGSISKVDTDTISIIIDSEPLLFNVENNRATLANAPVTTASAVYHAISIVTDGLGLSWYLVGAELSDPTDVSVDIGLMTKQ